MELRKTAKTFWRAFDQALVENTPLQIEDPKEALRLQSILAYTALDASLCYFWREEICPNWSDYLCLIQQFIADSSALEELVNLSQPILTRSQWIATLRFLVHSSDPEKFTPTFTDVGTLLFVWAGARAEDEAIRDLVNSLFKMQKIRNDCLHTGRGFTELEGLEGLKLIHEFRRGALQLSPLFECLSDDIFLSKAKAA